jgi:Protein of unknown function (DUF3617)
MKTKLLAISALLLSPAFAADPHMKPGLWEFHVTKNVIDGQDHTAQLAAMSAQMQQAMANLPPDQQARIQAAMKTNVTGGGKGRICITPEMANRDTPLPDQTGRCPTASVQRNGDHMTFEFSCVTNGMSATGKGESTLSSELVTTRSEITTHAANGTAHVMQNESELRYVGPDCGDVKPPGAAATH